MDKKEETLKILLQAWEETYKKGQLTLWIFLSLKDGKKYVDEIKSFVEAKSLQTITCEEQSLYRVLRKYEHIGVVAYELGKGNKGPERKYYFLTELGENLFSNFVERNINLFYNQEIINLLNK
jgi:DNA-binding PadR family transcriptional regulator